MKRRATATGKSAETTPAGDTPVEGAGEKGRRRGSRRGRTDTTTPRTVTGVNLLSPWVHDQLRTHRLQRRFAAGVVALATLVVAIFGIQHVRLMGVEDDLAAEEARTFELNRQINALLPVSSYVEDVESRADLIAETMHTEVAFSRVVTGVRDVAPTGVSFDSVSASIPSPSEERDGDPADRTRGLRTSCGGPDPFAVREVVGCVSLSGTARDRATVGQLVDALDAADLFVEPFITSTSAGPGDPVTFAGSVGISPDAFSGRFDTLVEQTRGDDPQDDAPVEEQP